MFLVIHLYHIIATECTENRKPFILPGVPFWEPVSIIMQSVFELDPSVAVVNPGGQDTQAVCLYSILYDPIGQRKHGPSPSSEY